uniref:Truncated follicle stimulating hormone receptor variant 3 n=1 Tax=Hippoglossus hippoglossus TaxID=8267 RepID=B1PXB7_HIPHI|nr:truncated follicle stimulating hormone receptor variant 3 [Hippoglossus hippoglossus]
MMMMMMMMMMWRSVTVLMMIVVNNRSAAETSLTIRTVRPCERLTEIPSNISSNTRCLEVKQTQIRVFPSGAVTSLQLLRKLTILENEMLESIGEFAFANLPRLSDIIISENIALESIGAYAFFNLPELSEM